jgi:heme oxygenase
MSGPGLAARLRAATAEQHRRAEGSPFVGDLMSGRLTAAAYGDLAGQLWFVYRALEEPARRLRDDPVVGPLLDQGLFRVPHLEADLGVLRGGGWREGLVPLPATARYAGRIAALVRDWTPGYLAHHYTRYLGDLSGGQIMRRSLAEQYSLPDGALSFFAFPGIPKPKPFKDRYRRLLDAAPLDDATRNRVAEEAQHAFDLNTALFGDLHRLHRPGRGNHG